MAFNYQIPRATDQLSQSQSDILANFAALGAIAGNASASSSSLNGTVGFNWVFFAPQGATPPAGSAFPADRVALYSFPNATTGVNELYVNRKDINSLTSVQIPMTAYYNNSAGSTNGWTYIPSGLKIAWGTKNMGAGTSITVTYSAELTGFPGFGTFYTAPQLTRLSGVSPVTQFVTISAYSATQFTVQSSLSTGSANFAWMAIGR